MSVTHDTMTCQCGSKIKMSSLRKHLLSKKHQKFIIEQEQREIEKEERHEKKMRERELKLPEKFWEVIQDRFESDLSFNSYSRNLEILMGEWEDTRMFNGKPISEDRVFDMEEAYRRQFQYNEDENDCW